MPQALHFLFLLKAKLFFLLLMNLHFLHAQPLEQTSFESFSDEVVFTQASWTSEGFSVPWVNGFNQNRAYVDDAYAHSGTKSLRVSFPQGQFGPSGSGAQAPLMVPAASEYYISYWLRFSDDFSWGNSSQGGKLPGLSGGGRCSGCATCTGSNGFSARLMWRTGGKAVLYLYHMDKTNPPCGDNINLQITPGVDFAFQRGQWYQIIERVKINTGNNYDGEVELWINEQPALLKTGIRFVNNGDQVDNLYFSTFHGGSDANWAPTVNSYIWFDDFVITANASDIFTTLSIGTAKPQDKLAKSLAEVKIFPQPMSSGGDFNLEISSFENEVLSMEWFDIYGKSLYLESKTSVAGLHKVPDLEKGFYILRIQLPDGIICHKVYVE